MELFIEDCQFGLDFVVADAILTTSLRLVLFDHLQDVMEVVGL